MLEEQASKRDFGGTDTNEAKKWLFQENIRLEQQRQELEAQRVQLEQQKKDFHREQSMAADRNRLMKRQLENEKRLFDVKWKLLEDELRKVAEDKRRIEQERQEYQALMESRDAAKLHYELFFIGVNSKQALKKRYKDLIKIFHPDNLSGDKATLQEINREYDVLRKIFI